MSFVANFWRSLSFGVRLTFMMVSLLLASIVLLTSLLFTQYQRTQVNATLADLEARSANNAEAFTAWLLARQDEMSYLAEVDVAVVLDLENIASLMATLANKGNYDTIFVVGREGRGLAGVSYEQGKARIMSTEEAYDFDVADRAWFRSAISGEDAFSEPIVSRATGNTVSTVAIPIRSNGQIVAVMRGAVKIDTLVERLAQLPRLAGTEIYLVGSAQGNAITSAPSIANLQTPLKTAAADNLREKHNFVGRYTNSANEAVIGSATFIPLLGWGLVVEQNERVALAEVSQMLITLVIVSAAIILVSVFICIMLVRAVTRTLGGDPNYASSVVHQVADGNLNTNIRLRDGDKTSLLASIFLMQNNLRKMLTEISSYSEQVAASSTQLAQISEQTEKNMELQAQEISNSATAMNEMSATLEEVARNTQSTASASSSARDAADTGRDAVQSTIESIKHLALQVNQATIVIGEVKGDSDRIGTILQVIESIAEQTNLLALNAAIEAARAGESGRGFAVVADEVRNLASRTKDSTTEIKGMIEKLQSGSDGAVRAMQVSSKGTEASVSLAGDTGEKLEAIARSIALIDDTAQQIATATEEQTMVAKEINESIHNISTVADENAENIKQCTQASESLAYLAVQLKGLVAQFRV
jgi:methyl-accepting chemotaxis protein